MRGNRGEVKLAGSRESEKQGHRPRHKVYYVLSPWKSDRNNPQRESQQRLEFIFKKSEAKRG